MSYRRRLGCLPLRFLLLLYMMMLFLRHSYWRRGRCIEIFLRRKKITSLLLRIRGFFIRRESYLSLFFFSFCDWRRINTFRWFWFILFRRKDVFFLIDILTLLRLFISFFLYFFGLHDRQLYSFVSDTSFILI